MIKRKVLKKKRKNPEIDIEKILESLKPFETIKFQKIGAGGYAETYLFTINYKKILDNNVILNPGEYLIKRFFNDPSDGDIISKKEINYLIKLSNYGLIPKIYFINHKYMIMNFIKGATLGTFIQLFIKLDRDVIIKRLNFLISKWHELGFAHGDLNVNNIMISSKNQVYLIDPNTKIIFYDDLKYYQNQDLEEIDYIRKYYL